MGCNAKDRITGVISDIAQDMTFSFGGKHILVGTIDQFLSWSNKVISTHSCSLPCRQSVRARASMKTGKRLAGGTAGVSKLATQQFTPLRPESEANTQSPPKSQDPSSGAEVPKRPLPKEIRTKPSSRKPVPSTPERSVSPELSDSDPEENYLNYSFQQFAIDRSPSKKRNYSGSESSYNSSVSEEGSSAPLPAKPPIATPRKKPPRSNSTSALESSSNPPPPPPRPQNDRPALPPRPNIPQIRKHNSIDDDEKEEPERPRHRPRPSEIKRAKDRARGNKPRSKNAPSLTVVNEDGFETMSTISSKSAKSNKSYSSSKSAPLLGDQPQLKKKRSKTSVHSSDGLLLAPSHPERHRTRSTNDDAHKPSGTADGGSPLERGEINTEALFKYISEDPRLKAALKEFITQDSAVAGSTH